MKSLYVGSITPYSGKSLLCLGLGRQFENDGLKIGYLKPFGANLTRVGDEIIDEDAVFIEKALSLEEPLNMLCPVTLNQDLIVNIYKGEIGDLQEKVLTAYKKLSRGKDLILIGGGKNIFDGCSFGLSGIYLVKTLNAKAILVDKYEDDMCVDFILSAKELLGDNLIGIVMNRIPMENEACIKDRIMPFLEKRGIPILGILPYDSMLNSVTVEELRDVLNGKIICCEDKLNELVENFSIGAMNVDSALKYFRIKKNKAVITGGDRSDIQLAALETSTKCLILTGDLFPNEIIINYAEQRQIPIMIVKNDTFETIEKCEHLLGRIRIRDRRKVERAVEMVKRIDFESIYDKLGMKTR